MPVSNTLNLTVNPQPAGLSLVTTFEAAAICLGQSATLTASMTPISGASYSINNSTWYTTTEFNVTPTSNESYTLYVKTTAGCTATLPNAVTIKVNPLPAVPTSPSSNSRCGSGTVTFSANAAGNTIDWYTTSTGTVLVSGGGSVTSFSPSIGSSTTYYAQARNSSGCVSVSRLPVWATVNPLPTNLMLTANPKGICDGQSSTLTASATDGYQYSRDNNTWQTATTFSVTPAANASYTLYVKTAAGCTTTKANAAVVAIYSAISPGAIVTDATTITAGANPNVTIRNSTAATGGSGSITYQWRRTDKVGSVTTLTGTNTTYAIDTDAAYATAGTYYFNRYAKDATCNTAWLASTGVYTLVVLPPVTLCTQCCNDGSSWVDCQVTTNSVANAQWIGNSNTTYFPGATSDRNGRANCDAITASPSNYTATSAVGVCKSLGDGWYLPAYEELVNMSDGEAAGRAPLNGRAGARMLSNYSWSSSEVYTNEGRGRIEVPYYSSYAAFVTKEGDISNTQKDNTQNIHCAWRQ
jgi:hypothetical protein